MTDQSLQGKYVFISGEEYYQTGYIEEQITPALYVVRIDNVTIGAPTSMILIPVMMMLGGMPEIQAATYDFFSTRKELSDYVVWIEGKTGPGEKVEKSRGDTVIPFTGKKKDS